VTVTNIIECDRCHEKTTPPRNSGWGVLVQTAPDGINVANALAHLCLGCLDYILHEIRAGKRLVQ